MRTFLKHVGILFVFVSCSLRMNGAAEPLIKGPEQKPEQQISLEKKFANLAKQQEDAEEKARIVQEEELGGAIRNALQALNGAETAQDFGAIFRAIIASQSIFSTAKNMQALLKEVLNSNYNNVKKIASLCEAELAAYAPSEIVDLEFIHAHVRDLNRENIWLKDLKDNVEKAYKGYRIDRNVALQSINDYLAYVFEQPENKSQYLVYAAVREIMDSKLIIDKDKFLFELGRKEFNDQFIKQWITKNIGYVKDRLLFTVSIKLPIETAFRKSTAEKIYFEFLEILQTLMRGKDWETLRPIVEELFNNEFFSAHLMIMFALETAKEQGIIRGLGDEWINKRIQKNPLIKAAVENLERMCHTTTTFESRQLAACLSNLKIELKEILQKHAMHIPFMYGFVKYIISNSKLDIQLKALTLGEIWDYYSENNLWNKIKIEEQPTRLEFKQLVEANKILHFDIWLRKQIERIDPVVWLQNTRPEIFANLPVDLDLFKDAIRSLFLASRLQRDFSNVSTQEDVSHFYESQEEYSNVAKKVYFNAVRLAGISWVLGFSPWDLKPARGQVWMYLPPAPRKKDKYFDIVIGDAFDLETGALYDRAKLELVVTHYKIHLMPKEDETEKITIDLLNEIKQNSKLKDNIIVFKILCLTERMLIPDSAPRIVIYITGKKNAQTVLNELVKLFGPKGHYKYEGSGRAPRYNQRVTDLIFFIQGDRDDKLVQNYDKVYEQPLKIYYIPTIFEDGKKRDFKLDIPKVPGSH